MMVIFRSLACFSLLVMCHAGAVHATTWVTLEQLAAARQAADAPAGLAPLPARSYFEISTRDLEKAVAEKLEEQGVASHVRVTAQPGSKPVLYRADHPIRLNVLALQVDPDAKRWQAQAYILADGKTAQVTPVAGRYDALIAVPVLTRQITDRDVIEASDLDDVMMPSAKLRKDTITDSGALIGKSARRVISAHRPIRAVEVISPKVIEKGSAVEMVYRTPYIAIRTTGEALEDGTTGALIRVKNSDSGRAVSAKVVSAGRVEVSPTAAVN
jgi:flagella basal body P-ring formation protein FlgA